MGLSYLTFVVLTTAVAFGIGYETDDDGAGPALFLMLTGIGLILALGALLSGARWAWAGLAFTSLPALIAAVSAQAGGRLRERRQS